jgi:hypothetical protein
VTIVTAQPKSLVSITRGEDSPDALQYSLLKLGRTDVVAAFASRLARQIRSDLDVASTPAQWITTDNMFCQYPRIASYQLARQVAHELGFPIVAPQSGFRFKAVPNYAALSCEVRHNAVRDFALTFDTSSLAGKHVILIDDCMVSGAVLAHVTGMLREGGVAAVYPYVVARIDGLGAGKFEDECNRRALAGGEQEVLLASLCDPRAVFTTRLSFYFFELSESAFIMVLDRLPPVSKLNLYAGFIRLAAQYPDRFSLLADRLGSDLSRRVPAVAHLDTVCVGLIERQLDGVLGRMGYRATLEAAGEILDTIVGVLRRAETG